MFRKKIKNYIKNQLSYNPEHLPETLIFIIFIVGISAIISIEIFVIGLSPSKIELIESSLVGFGTLILAIAAFIQIVIQQSEEKKRKIGIIKVLIARIQQWIIIINDIERLCKKLDINPRDKFFALNISLRIFKKNEEEYKLLLAESRLFNPHTLKNMMSLFDKLHIMPSNLVDDAASVDIERQNHTDYFDHVQLNIYKVFIGCLTSFLDLIKEGNLENKYKKEVEEYKIKINSIHKSILNNPKDNSLCYPLTFNSIYSIHRLIHVFSRESNIPMDEKSDLCLKYK